LILAAMFWGTTFVAQALASDSVEPFTFNGIRMSLGGAFLFLFLCLKNKGKPFRSLPNKKSRGYLFVSALICGVLMFFAANFQQAGIDAGTSAGKSGFITAMYVVFVPLFGIFLGKKVKGSIWGCVIAAAVGLYLLCMADFEVGFSGAVENLKMTRGDLFTLICAVCFTLHIMTVDHFAPRTDGVLLSSFQFLFAGAFGLVAMLIFEHPTLAGILQAMGGILYSAIFSCCVAYTLQILGQKETPAAVAAILMCLESVFAVISDALILHTTMSVEEWIGCGLMFVALVVSSLAGVEREEKPVGNEK